jgi:4-carboxymuconolactone decarboxylase
MDDASLERGRALRARVQGAKSELFTEGLIGLDPRMAEWSDGWIFGDVWEGEGIGLEDRVLVAVVALAATAKTEQLRNYLHGALQADFDPRRIHEALLMLPVYVGFPTAIQALVVWRAVVESARRHGQTIDLPGA